MNLDSVKVELARYILETEDKAVIKNFKAVMDTASQDNWWDELPDEIKISVEKGLEQAERGEGIPHKEVMKKYNKWLKK